MTSIHPSKDDKDSSSHPQTPAESVSDSPEANGVEPSKDATTQDDELTKFPRGAKLVIILVALCTVNLLISVDQSIVSTAIPRITDEFHDVAAIGWYGSAYLLSLASFQMFYGRMFTLFPIKIVFLVAIIIFEVGSIVCGAAPDSDSLIVGRTVAGIGGAGIWAGILVIIAHCVPLRLRPIWAGLDSITFGLGSVLGPLIGGAFTDNVSWRWCFYINAPFGFASAIAIAIFMPSIGKQKPEESPTGDKGEKNVKLGWRQQLARFDPLGIITVVVAMVFLLLALQYGGTVYPWSSGRIIAFLVIFAVFTVAFILTQIFGDSKHRAIPKAVALQRTVIGGSLYFFCMGGCFMLLIYYLPVWFQSVQGVSAFTSGVKTIPIMLAYVVSSIISGIAITKIGYYTPFILASSVMMAAGAGMLSTLRPDSSAGAWIGYQVLYGFGLGLGCDVPFVAAQTVLPLHLIPSATAVLMLFQTLGASTFISVGENVFTSHVVGPLSKLVPGANPVAILNLGITNLRKHLAESKWSQLQNVLNAGLDRAFLVAAIMAALTFAGAVLMEHKSVKSGTPAAKDTQPATETEAEKGQVESS